MRTGRDGAKDTSARRTSGRPSAAGRAVPMLVTFLGVLIVATTQAVERGIVGGIGLDRTAYVFGGVLIVLGIVGLGRRTEEAEAPPAADGPIRESGREAGEADERERLEETLRAIERERRARSGLGSDR